MTRLLLASSKVAFLLSGALMASAAQACSVPRPLPSDQEIKAVSSPKTGIIGTVISSIPKNSNGAADVTVRVEQAYGKAVDQIIQVHTPGCCLCVSIPTEPGEKVKTIIEPSTNGLFYLVY